ncbi:hypothetical protein EK21DRAFT_40361, partial [Setomelanomma holmii]
TPQDRKIRKVESLHRHRMTSFGPEEQFLVTIFTSRRTIGELKDQFCSESLHWRFSWDLVPGNLHPMFKPEDGARTYGSCL